MRFADGAPETAEAEAILGGTSERNLVVSPPNQGEGGQWQGQTAVSAGLRVQQHVRLWGCYIRRGHLCCCLCGFVEGMEAGLGMGWMGECSLLLLLPGCDSPNLARERPRASHIISSEHQYTA